MNTRNMNRILLTGTGGQIGNTLLGSLRKIYGSQNIFATDMIRNSKNDIHELDVRDSDRLEGMIKDFKPDQIIHLAAILSASGEKNPQLCYDINLTAFKNILDLSMKYNSVYGVTTPKLKTPNTTIQKPSTIYGCTKSFGELLGTYYHNKFGLDYRSLRYPQVVSASKPGGGSGDYITEIFYEVIEKNEYQCYLHEQTLMPFLHIEDLVKGTIQFLETDSKDLTDRIYNVQSCAFTVKDVVEKFKQKHPNMKFTVKQDFRQKIVDSWPSDMCDSLAKKDWQWNPKYSLDQMFETMYSEIYQQIKHSEKITK